MKNRWLLSAAVLFSAVCANPASALERGPQYHYDKGVELYERQQYGSALAEFKKALGAMSVDDAGYRMRARYYAALCAAERQQTGAREMLERFVEDYPNSIYLNDVHFALGTILEKEGDYQRAYEHLLTVNPHELPYSRIGSIITVRGMPPTRTATRIKPILISRIVRPIPLMRPMRPTTRPI